MYYKQRKAYSQRDPRVRQSRNARGHPTTTTTALARARASERKRRGRSKKT